MLLGEVRLETNFNCRSRKFGYQNSAFIFATLFSSPKQNTSTKTQFTTLKVSPRPIETSSTHYTILLFMLQSIFCKSCFCMQLLQDLIAIFPPQRVTFTCPTSSIHPPYNTQLDTNSLLHLTDCTISLPPPSELSLRPNFRRVYRQYEAHYHHYDASRPSCHFTCKSTFDPTPRPVGYRRETNKYLKIGRPWCSPWFGHPLGQQLAL